MAISWDSLLVALQGELKRIHISFKQQNNTYLGLKNTSIHLKSDKKTNYLKAKPNGR